MNELARVEQTISLETAAKAAAQGGLFGRMTEPQILSLFLLAQAEGIHPFKALQEYDIIQGRPALKQSAALARFQRDGGKVEWLERTEARVTGRFTHPAGGSLDVSWDIERAKKIGLAGKDNWRNYPREMLTWRCVAEGVRAVAPGVLQGMYLDAEVRDFATPDDEYVSVFEDEPMRIVPPDPQTNSSGPGYVPPAQRVDVSPIEGMTHVADALPPKPKPPQTSREIAKAATSGDTGEWLVVDGETFDFDDNGPKQGIVYTLQDSEGKEFKGKYWSITNAMERSGMAHPQQYRGIIAAKRQVRRPGSPYDLTSLRYLSAATPGV